MGFGISDVGRALAKVKDLPGKIIQAIDDLAVPEPVLQAQELHRRVALRLTPYVRQELAICFQRSGIKSKTGQLYNAAVTSARVEATPSGFKIHMGAGFDDKVYARASVFKHGALRKAEGSEREKRKLKKSAAKAYKYTEQKKFGGTTFIPPKGFFKFTADQLARLNRIRDVLLAQEQKAISTRGAA